VIGKLALNGLKGSLKPFDSYLTLLLTETKSYGSPSIGATVEDMLIQNIHEAATPTLKAYAIILAK
jgi:hypothetical protein